MKPSKLIQPTYSYMNPESDAANAAWGMNCGPGAFAAMLNVTPDDIRPIFDGVGFPEKKYTNAVMMMNALRAASVPYRSSLTVSSSTSNPPDDKNFGNYTLCRIQWHGPWTKEGVPIRARLRYTHWVGAMSWRNPLARTPFPQTYIFDINAGWQMFEEWNSTTAVELAALYKRSDGKWSITHRLELFS